MIEFGSDFHYINNTLFPQDGGGLEYHLRYFASGRQAIQVLISHRKWERIWIPKYFCYDIITSIKSTGIEVILYPDAPDLNDIDIISKLNFQSKDVLLRMNFFGLRTRRDNSEIPVEVIEDHSHDLTGPWARNSNADWCIASIRKTIPVPEGGVLWSPKHHTLPQQPGQNLEVISLVEKRRKAMLLKTKYLKGEKLNKDTFRKLYMETESEFDNLTISDLTEDTRKYFLGFDLVRWNEPKSKNWKLLTELSSSEFQILFPEEVNCNQFSFIMLFNSEENREKIRHYLIENMVYPAILWRLPSETSGYAKDFSNRMLAIHCDARYSEEDIIEMRYIIERALNSLHND